MMELYLVHRYIHKKKNFMESEFCLEIKVTFKRYSTQHLQTVLEMASCTREEARKCDLSPFEVTGGGGGEGPCCHSLHLKGR